MGYVTQDIPAGKYVLIGCPFESTTGESLDIQKFISGDMTLRYWPDGDDLGCATIQVPAAIGYDTYTWEWTGDEDEDGNPVCEWMNDSAETAELEINPGFSCWFKNPTAVRITVAGQVAGTDKDSLTLPKNKYVLVANPFPENVELNGGKIDGSDLTLRYWPDGDDLGCATIQVPATIGYDTYTWEWTGDEDEDGNPVCEWMNDSAETATYILKAFTGVWMKDPNGGTVKFAL